MTPLDTPRLLEAGAALAAVLLLLWGAAKLLERRGALLRPNARLGIAAACALDARRRLLVIRCDGREALLLTGPGGEQFLGWLPEAAPRDGAEPEGGRP
ncbi:MAG: flagellar biosynthetic protein FliO [Roseococcus sp.]|nr:flagellar biosynthetic protein FliO [Roseococcus sp.]